MAITFDFTKFAKQLEGATDELLLKVDEVMTEGAEKIEERAKNLAPDDRGLLRGQIFAETKLPFEKHVTIAGDVLYAAYQEFGTKKKFKDQGYPDVAKSYKGKGRGDYFDFLNNILDWVKRKGLADTYNITVRDRTSRAGTRDRRAGKAYNARLEQVAQAVALSIIRHGIAPANEGTGYFFRAYNEMLPGIIQDIEKIK